jgi:hypothetical protein
VPSFGGYTISGCGEGSNNINGISQVAYEVEGIVLGEAVPYLCVVYGHKDGSGGEGIGHWVGGRRICIIPINDYTKTLWGNTSGEDTKGTGG